VSCALLASLLLSAPAIAADRARLSADLAAQLAAGAPDIDVIVHGTRAEVDELASRYNLRVNKYLKTGAVLHVNSGQLAALAADGSQDHLSSDIAIHSTINVTAETAAADRLWDGFGGLPPLSGVGVGVAVIDSGIDTSHAALQGRVVAMRDFTGGDGIDRFGHGTHVAALIAGSGGGQPIPRDFRGIAYGAHLINLRVLDDKGSGKASSVIEAIDWAIDNRELYGIRIINLSIGAPVLQPYRDDPLCEAAERAAAAGLLVVASAGNNGVTRDGMLQYGGVTSPGNDPQVLTIGAIDAHDTADRADDTVAAYSSRGPTTYDLVAKPNLLAPGTRVVSAEAAGALLAAIPERHVAGSGSTAYMRLSGTSMAAAVVSGAAALLLQQSPALTPAETIDLLEETSAALRLADSSAAVGSLDTWAAAQLLDAVLRGAESRR
jgi:serine protease AprX